MHKRGIKQMMSESFDLFKGVQVQFLDIHMWQWDKEPVSKENIIEINHCYQGRYECEFEDNSFYYLGEGNLAISRLAAKKKRSGFPVGVYKGFNILINLDNLDDKFIELLDEFYIDTDKLLKKWKKLSNCKIIDEAPMISHIFTEIYNEEKRNHLGYIKLKVVELLMFLQNHNSGSEKTHQHFSRNQVEKVKHIKEHLEENLEEELTLEELSKDHNISESSIKRCFQAIYGKTPNQYRKEFRMQTAAKLLVETDRNISDIGMDMGYLNSSKFSTAFHSVMNMTPSEYRNEKKYQ